MSLVEIVDRLHSAKVLVVGDAIIDKYLFGRVDRMCPEAPVPVFITEREEIRLGGAANVRNQVVALGAGTVLHALPFGSAWTCKTRYMTGQHLLLRVDADASVFEGAPQERDYEDLESTLEKFEPDVIILSDYAKGWVTAQMAKQCIDSGIPVIVDPKGADWTKYRGCTLICPNDKEMAHGAGFADFSFDVLWKRGAAGMTLYTAESGKTEIPAKARRVYDVTGAGDTVVAVVATAFAVGASLVDAARLATLAAGHVVGELGTAVCQLATLRALAEEEDR